ncbi:MAG: pentapeptide repeat-containing protein [Oscillospiraceae bacterium]|nr:pentapeptide repeat-containing protein [Oscillospiraceae bacterium]
MATVSKRTLDGFDAHSKRISFRVTDIDVKKYFTAIGKGLLCAFVTHSADGVFGAAAQLAESFGFGEDLSVTAYKLCTRAMGEAMRSLSEVPIPLTFRDETGGTWAAAVDSAAERAAEGIPEIFYFHKGFWDDPFETDFYKHIVAWLRKCLSEIGAEEKSIDLICYTLKNLFADSFRDEWRKNPDKYKKLEEYFYNSAEGVATRQEEWAKNNERLERLVEEGVFGENYGLRQIYVPLNAYYTNKAEQERRMEADPEKFVVQLDSWLLQWLETSGPEDSYRVISGEPGSGKSTFAKMFAYNNKEKHNIIYVPLHEMNFTSGEFRTALAAYTKKIEFAEDLLDRKELLVILDGLDELTEQNSTGVRVAGNFVSRVISDLKYLNGNGKRIKVIFTGRIPAVQDAADLFNKAEYQLRLLGFYQDKKEKDNLQDPQELLKDYRIDWWRQYAGVTGLDAELPKAVKNENLLDLTSSPLTLHLTALCYKEDPKKFTALHNRAGLYKRVLDGVFHRGPKTGGEHPLARALKSFDNFLSVLSDIAAVMWHNANDRAVPLTKVAEYCRKNNHEELLRNLRGVSDNSDITKLCLLFYGQKASVDGAEAYEFTHKSFGEFLVARQFVEKLKAMAEDRDEERSLRNWLEFCGHTMLRIEHSGFIRGLVAMEDRETVVNWRAAVVKRINYVLAEGMPCKSPNRPGHKEETRQMRNAEIALLAAHSACALATEDMSASAIEWSGKTDDGEWEIKKAAGGWLNRLRGRADCNIVKCHLNHLDFSGCVLFNQDFSEADLSGSIFNDAFLNGVCFAFANLKNTELKKAKLNWSMFIFIKMANCDLTSAEFLHASLMHTDFTSAILSETSFDEATTQYCIFPDEVLQRYKPFDISKLSLMIKKEPDES